jgi:hypothetical protein
MFGFVPDLLLIVLAAGGILFGANWFERRRARKRPEDEF